MADVYASTVPFYPCPKCSCGGRWLEYISAGSQVDYYRCECSHVWTVSEDARHQQRGVTVPAESSPQVRQPIDA
jgi:hypothetical protein